MEPRLKRRNFAFVRFIMTSMAFILGVFPLVIATGAGAAAEIPSEPACSAGWFGGHISGDLFRAALFVLIRSLSHRLTGKSLLPLKVQQMEPRRSEIISMRRLASPARIDRIWRPVTVGPDFTKPDATTPNGFRMAEPGDNAASIANTPWWKFLKDQELQKLIHRALEENKDLRRAVAAVEEFQARLIYCEERILLRRLGVIGQRADLRPKKRIPSSRISQPVQLLCARKFIVGTRYLGAYSSVQSGRSRRTSVT